MKTYDQSPYLFTPSFTGDAIVERLDNSSQSEIHETTDQNLHQNSFQNEKHETHETIDQKLDQNSPQIETHVTTEPNLHPFQNYQFRTRPKTLKNKKNEQHQNKPGFTFINIFQLK